MHPWTFRKKSPFLSMFFLCVECQDGFYGITCNVTCGNCNDGQPCDKDTGECMNGCDSYVKPPLCKGIISI